MHVTPDTNFVKTQETFFSFFFLQGLNVLQCRGLRQVDSRKEEQNDFRRKGGFSQAAPTDCQWRLALNTSQQKATRQYLIHSYW